MTIRTNLRGLLPCLTICLLLTANIQGDSNSSDFTKVFEVFGWVTENITYRVEHDWEVYGRDFWQTPMETYELRRGDCEDLALLMQEMLHSLGVATTLLLVDSHIPEVGHVFVRWGHYVFDPSVGTYTFSAAHSWERTRRELSRSAAHRIMYLRR